MIKRIGKWILIWARNWVWFVCRGYHEMVSWASLSAGKVTLGQPESSMGGTGWIRESWNDKNAWNLCLIWWCLRFWGHNTSCYRNKGQSLGGNETGSRQNQPLSSFTAHRVYFACFSQQIPWHSIINHHNLIIIACNGIYGFSEEPLWCFWRVFSWKPASVPGSISWDILFQLSSFR